MMKRRAWVWRLTALLGIILLLTVFGYRMTHSPRWDALEPLLMRSASLDDFRQVAAAHHIPFEHVPNEPGEPPDLYTNFIVSLDGSMWGKTLRLKFRNDKGYMLWSAVVVGRDGKEEWWRRTHW